MFFTNLNQNYQTTNQNESHEIGIKNIPLILPGKTRCYTPHLESALRINFGLKLELYHLMRAKS